MPYFYLSFASDKAGFLAATIVEANSAATVVDVATAKGLNPGGEVLILPAPEGLELTDFERTTLLDRLASRQELESSGQFTSSKNLNDQDRALVDRHAIAVCEGHNKVTRQ